jgi:cysteine desulfurase
MQSKAYLDHHTATCPLKASVEAMFPFFQEHWGSTLAPHQKGQELFPPLKQGVETILQALGAKAEDRFYFFSSHAEAIQHLFLSHYFDHVRHTGKNHLVITNMEEAPVLMGLKRLEEVGCAGKILSVNPQGQLTQDILETALGPRTSLVSVSWANGLTGVVHPIEDIAATCHAKGVKLHVDASYIIGKRYFRFDDLPIDFLTFEGSLLHAPKGTAGLLIKEHALLAPPLSAMMGAPVGGIVALARALEEHAQQLDHMCLETARLRDQLEQGIIEGFPQAQVLFSKAERLPNCSAIAFPGVINEALLFLLQRKGVYASLGHLSSHKLSELLISCGMDQKLARCALSFSLSFDTTEEEINYAIDTIVASAKKLKKLSDHFDEGVK